MVARPFKELFQVAHHNPPRFVLSFDPIHRRPIFVRVKMLTCRDYEGEFVHIRTKMGRSLTVTADHPVVIYDASSDNFQVVPAHQVQQGNLMVSIGSVPELSRQLTIDLLPLLVESSLASKVKVRPKNGDFRSIQSEVLRKVPRELMSYPYDIRRRNCMPLLVYHHLCRISAVNDGKVLLFTTKGTPTYCPSRFVVDFDFMRMVGYYISKGCIVIDKGRKGAVREQVNFTFRTQESELIGDLKGVLNRYGIRFLERRTEGAVTLVISSEVFAFLLRDVLGCGDRSENKRLPNIAFNVDESLQASLLQGLFSGDGCVSTLNGGNNGCFEYATVSKALADGVILLLQSLGFVPSLKTCRMKKSKQETYIIRINGLQQLERLAEILGRTQKQALTEILKRYRKRIQANGYKKQKGFVILPVAYVERFRDRREVYSMETENGLLVAGSGLVVHNCLPKDLKAFIHIAEEHRVDFSLLKEVERINEARIDKFVRKVQRALWVLKDKTLAIWGLAFKPNTDDIREAPSLKIISRLLEEGANLRLYDPAAMENVKQVFPEDPPKLVYCKSAVEAATNAHAILLVTEWDEFRNIDWAQIRQVVALPIIVDGRNCLSPEVVKGAGFEYYGMGRK
ncbi:MAG: UDP binding domain-containing protein [Armatimonadota bacterium]